jgi:hypothetical protein
LPVKHFHCAAVEWIQEAVRQLVQMYLPYRSPPRRIAASDRRIDDRDVRRMPRTPAAESASAAPILAQQIPTAPAATCFLAIQAHLCLGVRAQRDLVGRAFGHSADVRVQRRLTQDGAGVGTRKREFRSPIMACANSSAGRIVIRARWRSGARIRQAARCPVVGE